MGQAFAENKLLPAPKNGGFRMDGYWVWCGSVVKGEDGKYHMFASRWPKGYPFHPGWCVASEIVRAVSDTPEGPYVFQEVVLPARGVEYWDGRMTHNPVIQKHGDTYVLFYIGTTHPFANPPFDGSLHHDSYTFVAARSRKRIGVAWAKSVYGPWNRPDKPALEVSPESFDNVFTSNPAPCIRADGSCLLLYKTRQWRKPPYDGCTDNEMVSDMMLAVAEAPHWIGPYRRVSGKPLFDGAGVLEDPFIWQGEKGYEMLAKDWKGTYTGAVGDLVQAHSTDGAYWQIEKGAAVTCDILWDDGKVHHMGNMDRPFLLFGDNGQATHLFVATNDGTEAGFKTMKNSWNMCIPLKSD